MSYRRWMKKWQPVVFWAVAFAFVAGVIWWSVATYLGGKRSAKQRVYSLSDATAYLTKDGSPLNDERYWVMPWDLNKSYSNIISAYGMTNVDPIFDEPRYKAIVLEGMLKERVQLYYADENDLRPTKEEIKEKLKEIEGQIKSNKNALNYIKSRYRSLAAYLESIKPDIEKSLTLKKVREKVASVGEEDMRKYFEEHAEELRNKYEKVDALILSFTDEASANTFLNEAKKIGFDKAATNSNLSPSDVPNITHGIFPEDVEKALFSATSGQIVGPFKIGSSWFVFKVKKVVKLESFDDFLASEFYETEKNNLENEKFYEWLENFMKTEKLGYHVNDEVLRFWLKYVENPNDERVLSELLDELEKEVIENGKVKDNSPDELKALYVIILESEISKLNDEISSHKRYLDLMKKEDKTEDEKKELSDLEKELGKMDEKTIEEKISELENRLNEYTNLRKAVVEYLYGEYPTSLEVLSRMVEIKPNDPKINFEYYDSLYSLMKPALQTGYIYKDRNLVFKLLQVQAGLYKVAYDASASTDMRAEALFDIYEMNKLLEDATSASITLSELQKIAPDFLDYESAYSELEEMMAPSSPATE